MDLYLPILSKAEVKLFGRPNLTVDGEVQPLPEKAFVLLAILAEAPSKTVSRSRLRTILWGDSDREKANANLRQLIARIHKVGQRFGRPLLTIEGDAVGIDATACDTDYGIFLESLRNEAGSGAAEESCETLLRLWGGPLLDGLSFDETTIDEWMEATREQIRHRFVDAARRALDDLAEPATADTAWRLALRVLDIDSTEEVAYRAMMRICAARGDRGLALRIFGRCRRVLATELGVNPAMETMDLAALLRHRAADAGGAPMRPARAAEVMGLPASPAAAPIRQIPVVMVLPPLSVMTDDVTRTLALGFVEDLTIGLTRFRRFSVVAPHSGAAVAFGSGNLEEALSVLDVDYAVATSLMPSAHGHRFGIRLTDMSSSEVLWATETDFTMATLGGTFERVIGLVVRSMVSAIEDVQIRAPIPAGEITAYRRYLEGRRLLRRMDLQAIRRARRMFREAMAQVPGYSAPLVGLSRTLSDEWLARGITEDDLLQESTELAGKAAALDPLDGRARREKGYADLYLRRHDDSLAHFEEALRLNPHDADIYADYADALAHSGDPQRGLEHCLRAIELNPIPPDSYLWILGSIYYQLGDYRAAMEALRQVEDNPVMARLLAACSAQLGDAEGAKHFSRVIRSVFPGFKVEAVRRIIPNRHPADTDHVIDGLRRAGLD